MIQYNPVQCILALNAQCMWTLLSKWEEKFSLMHFGVIEFISNAMKTNHQHIIRAASRSRSLFALHFLFGRKTWFQIILALSATTPFGGIKAKNQCTHSAVVFFSSYTMFPNITCDHLKPIVWSNKFCFVKFQTVFFNFISPRRCFTRAFRFLRIQTHNRADATEYDEAFGYWVAAEAKNMRA